jgi:hypothetical protein
MKGLRFTVYRHPWQRLGRETTQGTWLEPPAKRGGQDCSEVLAAAGRLHIPETRTDTAPPSSDFFANLHTCSRPATFRKSPHSSDERFSSRATDSSSIGTIISGDIIFRRVYPCIYRHAFIRSAGTGTKISFPALPVQPP